MEETEIPGVGADPTQSVIGQSAADGSFLGIPYGLPLLITAIVGVLLLLALLWALRGPIHSMGTWLLDQGRKAREEVNERIASYRAEEYQDRLMAMSHGVRVQAEKLPGETGPIIGKLEKSATTIELAADHLSSVSIDDLAERPVQDAVKAIRDKGLDNAHKAERNAARAVAVSMKEQMAAVRPQLVTLKAEAPRVARDARRLQEIHAKFDANARRVSDAYVEFEDAIHTNPERRMAAAGRQSIVIPLLIALFITAIALSGVFLNFFLIQRPMAEIVGEGAKIGGIGLPTFAALIVIFLEFVAGVVLMDAAGFTRLIPNFSTMSDTSRRIMFWVAFVFLTTFCALEIMLATVREGIIEAEQETRNLAISAFNTPVEATETAPPPVVLDAPETDAGAVAAEGGVLAAEAAEAAPAAVGPSPMIVSALGLLALLAMGAVAVMGEKLGRAGQFIGLAVAATCVAGLCAVSMIPGLFPSTTAPGGGMSTITMAQILLAGLIPWLLATAALPLETIVRNSVFLVHIIWSLVLVVFGSVIKAIGEVFFVLPPHGSPEHAQERRNEKKEAKARERELRDAEEQAARQARADQKAERRQKKRSKDDDDLSELLEPELQKAS